MTSLLVLCCFSLLMAGVFGDPDEMKSVSVYEGESVTLQTDTNLQRHDKILWRFEEAGSANLLVEMFDYKIIYGDYVDGTFKDRPQILDSTSGDLTIKNMRIKHTGVYEAEIQTATGSSYKRFNVTVKGVFGDPDEIKSVSVYEGESVTLQTDTNLQRGDKILWRFEEAGSANRLVEMFDNKIIYEDYVDGTFKDRPQILNTLSGDLTIKNMRIKHTGVYEAEIQTTTGSSYKRFNVTVKAVFSTGESVSVMGGDSVTLSVSLTETQIKEGISWRFGPQKITIAEIEVGDNHIRVYDDRADGRFRDRLKLDHSGSLTITNTRTTHTGLYRATQTSTDNQLNVFNLTVVE